MVNSTHMSDPLMDALPVAFIDAAYLMSGCHNSKTTPKPPIVPGIWFARTRTTAGRGLRRGRFGEGSGLRRIIMQPLAAFDAILKPEASE
jgi:hypothetical protein